MSRNLKSAAMSVANAETLAYVVILTDQADAEPRLCIPNAKDASEYEFQSMNFDVGTPAGIVGQCLGRISRGLYAADAFALLPNSGRSRLAKKWRERLMVSRGALAMAQAFLADAPAARIEVGANESGAMWGYGMTAVIAEVKEAEKLMAVLAAWCERHADEAHEDAREHLATTAAFLARAVIGIVETRS